MVRGVQLIKGLRAVGVVAVAPALLAGFADSEHAHNRQRQLVYKRVRGKSADQKGIHEFGHHGCNSRCFTSTCSSSGMNLSRSCFDKRSAMATLR